MGVLTPQKIQAFIVIVNDSHNRAGASDALSLLVVMLMLLIGNPSNHFGKDLLSEFVLPKDFLPSLGLLHQAC